MVVFMCCRILVLLILMIMKKVKMGSRKGKERCLHLMGMLGNKLICDICLIILTRILSKLSKILSFRLIKYK